jgi:phosphate-selective porin
MVTESPLQRRLTLVAAGFLSLVLAMPAFAQRAAADPLPTSAAALDVPSQFGACWDEHPCLRFGDMVVESATAALQSDWWRSDVPVGEVEEIRRRDIARRRVGVTVRLFNHVEVRAEREFADEGEPWRDRYVNVRPFEALQVRVGAFLLPFSRDAHTQAGDLPFLFHSQIATLLAPGRDTGVMVHGTAGQHRLGYEIGVFRHDGEHAWTGEAGRVRAGQTLAGRLTVQPWRAGSARHGALRASVAFTSSDIPEGTPSLNARTVLDTAYYASKVYVNGHQRRLGADAEWRTDRCVVLAEYARAYDERLGESVEDTDLSPFEGEGWLVGGLCTVFGTRLTTGGPSARTLWKGGGAVEVGARVERLRFGSAARGDEPSTSPRADVIPDNGSRILTLGVNWHINRWLRVQANAVRESLTRPEAGPFPDRPHFWSRLVRLQFLL